MHKTELSDTEYAMLALESPKPHLLPGRKMTQMDRERYMSVNDMDVQDKRNRNYVNPKSHDYRDLRDGAVNRSVDTGSYIQKKSKRSSKLDISSQDVFKSSKPKYLEYPKQKARTGSLGYGEDNVENFGMKKKSRLNGNKKGVLKEGLDTLDKSKPNRLRQKYERENSYQKDLLGSDLIHERRGFSKHSRDSSSYSDFSSLAHVDDDKPLKRLTSANRPKSAGQAMYMTVYSSDSEDSFYDGEIEVVDLDDPVFAYEREFEESKSSGNGSKTNRPLEGAEDTTMVTTKITSPRTGNHDNSENMYKQTTLSPESGLGSKKKRPQSDRTDAYPQSRPSTSHGRRRAQSEPEVERKSMIPTKTDIRKSKLTLEDKRLSKPFGNESFGSESFYSNSVDKVISKYSGLTVKKGISNVPSQSVSHVKRSDTYQARAPLPRKLKPILRREKIGHVNSAQHGEIDYQVSQ